MSPAMRPRPTTVRVWADIRERGRCKYCQHVITWVTTDMGKRLPFDIGFTVRDTVRDAQQRRYDVLSFDDFHKCAKRPKTRGPAPRLF